MKQNKIFDKIINETRTKKYSGINWNRLFEAVLESANNGCDNVGELEVPPEFINRPLSSIFNDVLNQCANENSLNYSTIAINKKSIPFNHLMQ